MKNQILPLICYSFVCTLFFSTASMAMDSETEELSSITTKSSLAYPVPPTITYKDYVENLCTENGSIDRWGKLSGNIGGWMSAPDNKSSFEDVEGELLIDLPFFQATLNPVVDENNLRCDYSVPIANSDLSKGASTFSLFCEATTEELDAVSKLKQESVTDYTTRLLNWQKTTKNMQQCLVQSKLLNLPFKPTVFTTRDTFEVWARHEEARSELNFCYLNFDGTKMKIKRFIQAALTRYVVDIDELKEGPSHDLSQGFDNMPTPTNYMYSSCNFNAKFGTYRTGDCLYDINGKFTIQTNELNIWKKTWFWTVGDLIIKPITPNYPIKKIEITAANSTMPIIIMGQVNFKLPQPQIDLEFINVSRVRVKLRPQNQ